MGSYRPSSGSGSIVCADILTLYIVLMWVSTIASYKEPIRPAKFQQMKATHILDGRHACVEYDRDICINPVVEISIDVLTYCKLVARCRVSLP